MGNGSGSAPRSLLLIGGGHAHIEVIRRWCSAPIGGVALSVFDPNPHPVYSGMVPGYVAGLYRRQELSIDLAALCTRAGARYEAQAVAHIDPATRRVRTRSGADFGYDVASLDIGSTVAGTDLPGVADHALASRPIARLVARIDEIGTAASRTPDSPFRVVVVGGGAAGVELAFCLEARLRRDGVRAPTVTLVTAGSAVLAGSPRSFVRRVERECAARGIETLVAAEVRAVQADAVVLEDGRRLPSQATLWATGPAPHPLARESGLPLDAAGFVPVTAHLEVEGESGLFAAGDCASLPGMGRAGVYAVRAAPVLDHNLRAALRGEPPRRYRPQSDFLSLLNLGDGRAIGTKWGWAVTGRSVMWLKDRIDRGFVRQYATDPAP